MKKKFFVFFAFLFISNQLCAESLTGVVKNKLSSGRSFALDLPPVIRVYLTSSTLFSQGDRNSLNVGDKVTVEGERSSNGLFMAKSITVQKGSLPSQDLVHHEKEIQFGQDFLLGVSQTVFVKDKNKTLKLKGLDFINSMCRDGYDCVNEGEVGMQIEVTLGSKKQVIELISLNTRKPVEPIKVKVFGYKIFLNECGEDIVSLNVRQ